MCIPHHINCSPQYKNIYCGEPNLDILWGIHCGEQMLYIPWGTYESPTVYSVFPTAYTGCVHGIKHVLHSITSTVYIIYTVGDIYTVWNKYILCVYTLGTTYLYCESHLIYIPWVLYTLWVRPIYRGERDIYRGRTRWVRTIYCGQRSIYCGYCILFG